MRDLVFFMMLFGVLVGLGCGTAQASAKSDLAQYRAESPNYSLEYLGEDTQSSEPRVSGEEDVQFAQQEVTPPTATELPSTNPPYLLISAGIAAVFIAILAYLALK